MLVRTGHLLEWAQPTERVELGIDTKYKAEETSQLSRNLDRTV